MINDSVKISHLLFKTTKSENHSLKAQKSNYIKLRAKLFLVKNKLS